METRVVALDAGEKKVEEFGAFEAGCEVLDTKSFQVQPTLQVDCIEPAAMVGPLFLIKRGMLDLF